MSQRAKNRTLMLISLCTLLWHKRGVSRCMAYRAPNRRQCLAPDNDEGFPGGQDE